MFFFSTVSYEIIFSFLILLLFVFKVQSSCEDCGIDFATYFCAICRMFDCKDDGKYHCEGCGICR